MCKYEEKLCPRCNCLFECKPGNITQSQCYGISLTETEKQVIETKYADCLCINCLHELKNEAVIKAKQLSLQKK